MSRVTMRNSGELKKKQKLWNQPNLSSNFFTFISYITKYKVLNFPMPQYLICKMSPLFYLPLNVISQINDLHKDPVRPLSWTSNFRRNYSGPLLATPPLQSWRNHGSQRTYPPCAHTSATDYAPGNGDPGIPCLNRAAWLLSSERTYFLGLTSWRSMNETQMWELGHWNICVKPPLREQHGV